MAKFGSLDTSNQINMNGAPDRPEEHFVHSQEYPASVIEVSKMLVHAHKDSLPLQSSSPRVSSPSRINAAKRLFKKSHTCGSLYAKCGCKDDADNSFDTFDVVHFPSDKRGSNPTIEDFLHPETKRFSTPEINNTRVAQVCQTSKLQKSTQKPIYKANLYLNHPEINFPIPIELTKTDCDRLVPNQSNISPDLKSKLDYHKYTALSYESHHLNQKEEEAQKFLHDFGIISPMGNGASIKKTSRSSIDDETNQQFKKTSKTRDLKKKISVTQEEFEHLKVVNERLKKDLGDLEQKHEEVTKELYEVKQELNVKNCTVSKLHREIHKLKVSLRILQRVEI